MSYFAVHDLKHEKSDDIPQQPLQQKPLRT